MGKRILVCDDKMFLRYLLRDILEEAGHQVIGEAENGEDLLIKYRTLKPDLVTLDITMPVMTGLEALNRVVVGFPGKPIHCWRLITPALSTP